MLKVLGEQLKLADTSYMSNIHELCTTYLGSKTFIPRLIICGLFKISVRSTSQASSVNFHLPVNSNWMMFLIIK